MTTYPSVERLAQLQQMIADFASVLRVPLLADKGRAENDVDHSYGLALTAWFLANHIAPELDQAKILKYALAHDLVELHAGDTFVFGDQATLDTKSDREDDAIDKLARDWADFPDISSFARDYKNKADEEAKFVYAVDKLLPVLMINLGEKDAFWSRHKITYEAQAEEKRAKLQVSKHVSPYYELLMEWISDPDYMYKPTGQTPSIDE